METLTGGSHVADPIFQIEMLPARQGDALWIEYGNPRRPSRVLVDAGTRGTYRIVKSRAAEVDRDFVLDVLVITHIDSDHIGGAPKLITDRELNLETQEIWFNGRDEIEPKRLGPVEGEILSEAIKRRGWSLNPQFRDRVAVVSKGSLPTAHLPGGMTITLLSPTPTKLETLRPVWEDVVREAGLLEGGVAAVERAASRRGVTLGPVDVEKLAQTATPADSAPANGSTIAFLAEYEGMSCLFAGDAHPDVLLESVTRLLKERKLQRLTVSALKVPHHGSQHNVTQELANLVTARAYLFSSDGTRTQHPHAPAVARILMSPHDDGAELVFNYKTVFNKIWDSRMLERKYGYRARFPENGEEGVVVELGRP
jgi:beta-lactamase superfamily II metal-dependent hydrolase